MIWTTRFVSTVVIAMALLAASARPAQAAVIEFQTTNLGNDQWMYEYFVSGFNFGADQGFGIFFDVTLFTNLSAAADSAGSDWEVLTIQPDTVLTSDGIYDALALGANASLAQPFSVSFSWLGGPDSRPGSQRFEIYQLADIGTPLAIGETTPRGVSPVPEPSTLLLVGAGTALAAIRRRRKV